MNQLEHPPADWSVGVADQQHQSPLYTILPPEIRLNIFGLALEEYCPKPFRHDFRVMYGHDDGPGDDGVSFSSVESAQFTNSDIDTDTDGEDSEDEPEHEMEDETAGQSGTRVDSDTSLPPVTVLSAEWGSDDEGDSTFVSEEYIDMFYMFGPHEPPMPVDRGLRLWIRPDWKGCNTIATPLLRTCRRIYLEVRDKVPENFTVNIWPMSGRYPLHWNDHVPRGLNNAITPRQRGLIRSAHLHEYEDNCRRMVGRTMIGIHGLRVFEGLEHIRHSMPSPGLHWPENVYPFGPYYSDDPGDAWVPHGPWGSLRPWGMAFRNLPRLKTFTMDFDATEEKREAVGELVEFAVREWRFRLGGDGPFTHLSAEGNPVVKTSWRGPMDVEGLWTPLLCLNCNPRVAQGNEVGEEEMARVRAMCLDCARDMLVREKGYGDRIYTWTVKWTARIGELAGTAAGGAGQSAGLSGTDG